MAPPKTKDATRGTVNGTLLNGLVKFTLRAVPLPPAVIDFLLSQTSTIGNMSVQRRSTSSEEDEQEERDAGEGITEGRSLSTAQFWAELEALLEKAGGEWSGAADRIWAFGPKKMGANLLLDPAGKTGLRWVYSFAWH
jgi:ribosome assembly protein 1